MSPIRAHQELQPRTIQSSIPELDPAEVNSRASSLTAASPSPYTFTSHTHIPSSAEPPLTFPPPTIRPRTWVLRAQQLKNMYSDKNRPGETANHHQHPAPIRHSPVCNDEPPVPADARRYDAVPIGVRVRVQQRPGVEGSVGGGHFDGGVVWAWGGGRGAVAYVLELFP